MKDPKQPVIPVHHMDSLSPLGIEFGYAEMTDDYEKMMLQSNKNTIHRDDYYLFLFLKKASAVFMLDFEEIQLQEDSIIFIRPGQVHFAPSVQGAGGWLLAIDATLVDKKYKNTFEGQLFTQRPISLDAPVAERLGQTAHLLRAILQAKQTAFSNDQVLNLANVFIGIMAEQYAERPDSLQQNKSRSAWIAFQFRELLSANFKTLKSPSDYAQRLNYSLSHLNESVKNITGFPVSYWIHQQVVLEAKRLLYHTDLNVKEIAFALGYEDHTYFSRLFSKTVGLSPATFRRKIHE
ncbi:AraC family transcriptional regulator [Bacteroides reticulotermitis]|uniref:AraC family transcriptional regulator n=1 Tax=Bacteroides reticulotermitis TaxID=1133319 RepID=UPI003A8A696B